MRRRKGHMVLVALLVLGAASWLLLVIAQPAWRAEASAVVVPAAGADPGLEAYHYDLVSRGLIPSTYGAILNEPATKATAAARTGLEPVAWQLVDVDVGVSPSAGVVTVSVTTPWRQVSEQMAQAVLNEGSRAIASLDAIYVLRPVKAAAGTATATAMLDHQTLAGVLTAVTAGVGLARWREWRTRTGR